MLKGIKEAAEKIKGSSWKEQRKRTWEQMLKPKGIKWMKPKGMIPLVKLVDL